MTRVAVRLMIAAFTFFTGVGLADLGISFGNHPVTNSEFELVRRDAFGGGADDTDGDWIYQASDGQWVVYSKSNLSMADS